MIQFWILDKRFWIKDLNTSNFCLLPLDFVAADADAFCLRAKRVPSLLLASTLAALALTAAPAMASTPPVTKIGYQKVERRVGSQSAINVEVYPGRISTIDFSQTNEAIAYAGLGDPSRIVFNTDFPLESGAAHTVFLRPIQPLNFPGATTARITNLVVKTIDPTGLMRLYNFQIVHKGGTPANLGVQIVPSTGNRTQTAINIGNGRTASLDDVETGLRLAIARGYTNASDPVVLSVKNFLANARNQDNSLVEAARAASTDLAVITELARIALFDFRQPTQKRETVQINGSNQFPNLNKKPKVTGRMRDSG